MLTICSCRRPTPGSGYLEALCSPKVEIIWADIESFNETGLRTATGRQVDADTIICATGFVSDARCEAFHSYLPETCLKAEQLAY